MSEISQPTPPPAPVVVDSSLVSHPKIDAPSQLHPQHQEQQQQNNQEQSKHQISQPKPQLSQKHSDSRSNKSFRPSHNGSGSGPASTPGSSRTMLPPDCTLYVSELDPNTTEAHLFEAFAPFGHIKSIRVIKDQLTRRSLGYAYVNFSKAEYAQAALADKHPKIILNRLCRVAQFHHKKDRQVYQQRLSANPPSYPSSPNGTTGAATNGSQPGPVPSATLGLETPTNSEPADTTVTDDSTDAELTSDTRSLSSNHSHASIFIKNLDPTITSAMLYDMFSSFGAIVSCKITMNEYGFSRGFGYISFTEKSAAENAIQKLNGALVNDRKVFVCHHMHKWERNQLFQELKHNFTTLFIKNVDISASDSDVFNLFTQFGPLESVSLSRDPIGRPKGFAFVKFKNHNDAITALKEFEEFGRKRTEHIAEPEKQPNGDEEKSSNEHSSDKDLRLFGRVLTVTQAQRRRDRVQQLEKQHQEGVNLYVKNLDDSINEKRLQELFAPFGTVVSTKIMTDINTGLSRGFGFVCFSSPEEATRALEEMNDVEVAGQQLIVTPAQRRNKHGMPSFIAGIPIGAAAAMSPGLPMMSPPLNQTPLSLNSSPIAGMGVSPAAAAAAAAASAGGYYGSPLMSPMPGYYFPPPSPNPMNIGVAAAAALNMNMNPAMYSPVGWNMNMQGMHNMNMNMQNMNLNVVPPNLASSSAQLQQQQPVLSGFPPSMMQGTDESQGADSASNMSSSEPTSQFGSPSSHGVSSFPGPSHNLSSAMSSRPSSVSSQTQTPPPPAPSSSSSSRNAGNGNGSWNGTMGRQSSHSYRNNKFQQTLSGSSLVAAVASAADPEAEKTILGEAIYPHVFQHSCVNEDAAVASKITGMLLEQDKNDLLRWMDDLPKLKRRILQAHGAYMEFVKSQ